jgi:hypothetical protein
MPASVKINVNKFCEVYIFDKPFLSPKDLFEKMVG